MFPAVQVIQKFMNSILFLSFRKKVYLRCEVQVLPPRARQPVPAPCGRRAEGTERQSQELLAQTEPAGGARVPAGAPIRIIHHPTSERGGPVAQGFTQLEKPTQHQPPQLPELRCRRGLQLHGGLHGWALYPRRWLQHGAPSSQLQ